MLAPRSYKATFWVEPDDIDDPGHVNNLVYLRWVQSVDPGSGRPRRITDEMTVPFLEDA